MLWISGKVVKTLGFYNNVHFHNCFDVASSTEMQYLQFEPSEKGAYINESMMLKMFYL